jgi:hypothetical protein
MLPLGTPVRFSHYLHRSNSPGTSKNRVWKDHPVGWLVRDSEVKVIDGIVVGHRTLTEGRADWEGYGADGGYWDYTPKESFRAYLVAWNVNRMIVRVKPEHIEELW